MWSMRPLRRPPPPGRGRPACSPMFRFSTFVAVLAGVPLLSFAESSPDAGALVPEVDAGPDAPSDADPDSDPGQPEDAGDGGADAPAGAPVVRCAAVRFAFQPDCFEPPCDK